jgi:hypothetical protein
MAWERLGIICAEGPDTKVIHKNDNTMKFAMEVGDAEKYLLEYQSNEWLGRTVIKVNNHEVKRQQRLFGNRTETHNLVLGDQEPINVRIEKEPRFPFGLRSRVFINSRLVRLFE